MRTVHSFGFNFIINKIFEIFSPGMLNKNPIPDPKKKKKKKKKKKRI
jgi:accessory gene regulator protein AgrB